MSKSSLPIKRLTKYYLDALRREIKDAGLWLDDASGESQLATLPKVLKYLGQRGLATIEGEALGYRRIATRVQDLESQGYVICVDREHVVTDDKLLHSRMARYAMVQEVPAGPSQLSLGI